MSDATYPFSNLKNTFQVEILDYLKTKLENKCSMVMISAVFKNVKKCNKSENMTAIDNLVPPVSLDNYQQILQKRAGEILFTSHNNPIK